MLLQLPAGILWCSLGSASHICPLLGLSHGLAMRRGVSWWGAQCSFGTAGSLKEQLCHTGTSWSSWPYQPRGIPLGGFASHGRLELLPDWLLLWSRWPSLHSHLGQLSGWQQWQWPIHILQPPCFLYLPVSLFHHLLHLSRGQGLSGWGWVMHRWWWSPPPLFQLPSLFSREEHPLLPLSFFLQGNFHSCHSIK